MKTLFRSWIVRVAALLALASGAFAQEREPFARHELDQMLAPVALYPDPLLTQILMASTYPLEVVQASRWSRANPGFRGRDAVQAVEPMDWDPSVKSLTAFPQVLSMMDEKIEWTERLGEAFLAQPGDVMDTVQGLRRRAEAAGNLRPGEHMQVAHDGGAITIAPPAPEIVYVPYYDPRVVYGPWWWPAHPPVYWAPAPAYYAVPAYRPAFLWGSGIAISAGFFFGHADWHHRHVTVVHRHVNHVTVNRTVGHRPGARSVWEHDSRHRRGVPFRNAEARQRFEQRTAAAVPARPAPRGSAPAAADTRQRRMDDRRKATEPGRDNRPVERRVERHEPASPPPAASAASVRPPVNREAAQTRPAPRPETRSAQPGPSSRPVSPQQTARRDPAPPRAVSNMGNASRPVNREAERAQPAARVEPRNVPRQVPVVEQRTAPRPAARSTEQRPPVARPAPRVEPRGNAQASPARSSPPRATPVRAAPAPRTQVVQRRADRG